MDRIWHFVESTDLDMANASEHILEHRHRRELLEAAAGAVLEVRRKLLDNADTIAAFAQDMSEFIKISELAETKAFVRSFVKEVQLKPGKAKIIYAIPTA